MDEINIPIVPLQANLEEAFRRMEETSRSAVVAGDGEKFWLIRAGHIVQALHRGEQTLSDVDVRALVYEATASDFQARHIDPNDLFASSETRRAVEALLDEKVRPFALSESPPVLQGEVRLITRMEKYKGPMDRGPKTCYCTDPDFPHPYDSRPADGKCQHDGSQVVCKS